MSFDLSKTVFSRKLGGVTGSKLSLWQHLTSQAGSVEGDILVLIMFRKKCFLDRVDCL